jgi:hypothetical protein
MLGLEEASFQAGCLTTLSVLRLYSVYGRMINEFGAVGGMRIDGGNPPECYFAHQKSQICDR